MGGCATKPKVLDKMESEAGAPLPPEESIVTTAAVDTKEEEVVVASSEVEQPGGSHRSLGLLLKENGESIGPPEADEVTVKDTITQAPIATPPDVEAEQHTKQEDPVVVEHSEPKAPVVEVVSVDSTSSNTAEEVEIVKEEAALQLAADAVKKESAAAEKVGDAELPAIS